MQLDPGNAAGRWVLGALLARQGHAELALDQVRRATEVGPEYTPAYQYLADWYL